MNEPSDSPAFRWLGHGSLFVPGDTAIAVDPWKWRYEDLQADVVLVTCAHVDHCCADDLARAASPSAIGIGPVAAESVLRSVFGEQVQIVTAGESLTEGDVVIDVLSHAGPPNDDFHPLGHGVTYRLSTPVGSYLFLGASRAQEEHVDAAPDVAFFGVGGLLFPTPADAVEDAVRVDAALSVPILWGDLHARFPAARAFLDGCAEHGLPASMGR